MLKHCHPPASWHCILLLSQYLFNLFPLLYGQLKYFQSVLNEIVLYFVVYICVCPERRHVVHFYHPRLQFVVKHYIEAKKIHAHVWFLRLAGPIKVLQLRLNDYYIFDDDFFNFFPNLRCRLRVNLPFYVCALESTFQNVS